MMVQDHKFGRKGGNADRGERQPTIWTKGGPGRGTEKRFVAAACSDRKQGHSAIDMNISCTDGGHPMCRHQPSHSGSGTLGHGKICAMGRSLCGSSISIERGRGGQST